MADIVIHHSAFALSTEVVLYEDPKYYAGYPNWAGYFSGIGIGIGFDIGASKITPTDLEKLLTLAKVELWIINELKKTCNITFDYRKPEDVVEAEKLVHKLKIEKGIKLTQQQCLDFYELTKIEHKMEVQKYFNKSFGQLHDALKEVYIKIHYGSPLLAKKLGERFDLLLISNDYEKQCEECVKSLEWVIANYQGVHQQVAIGFKRFVYTLLSNLRKKNNVIINHEPTTVSELIKDNSYEIISEISKEINRDFRNADQLRLVVENTKNKQPSVSGPITKESILDGMSFVKNGTLIIQTAQQKLVELGCYERAGIAGGMANADGSYGDNTNKALIQFQTENKLGKTGVLDEDTKNILLNITKKEKGGFFDFSTDDDNNQKQEVKVKEKNLVEQFLENFKNYQPKAAVEGTDYILLFKNTASKGKGKISGSVGVGGNNKPEDVVIVRALLSKLGYLSFHIENSFFDFNMYASLEKSLCTADADLFNSIKNLQKDNGLAFQNGRVDPEGASMTILNGGKIQQQTVINNNNTNNNITPEPGPIEQPEGKEGLRKIQTLLIKEGFLAATYFSSYSNSTVSSADGVWGNASANSLLEYQKKYGLSPTAKIDKETLDFMKNRNSKPKEEEFSTVEVSAGSGFYPCFN
jgi:peptidoglycan hydrolase-like protein with peptidoglycan-binding domain